jgi:hypothetical protein
MEKGEKNSRCALNRAASATLAVKLLNEYRLLLIFLDEYLLFYV